MGLGGRDISASEFESIINSVIEDLRAGKPIERRVRYWGVKA